MALGCTASTSRGATPVLLLTRVGPAKAGRAARRSYADLAIKHSTGLPILASGPAGRHANSGHVATVFGSSGFLGRYVVQKLARKGTQVVVPYRNADNARFLKVMGDLGRIVHMEWDLRRDDTIEECVRHSDVVINVVGREWETRNFSFQDIYVDGPRRMAKIAHEAGVSRFIHVSHMNADARSVAQSYRAKAAGEQAVADAFPGATIVRPSWLFGTEDNLLNLLANAPWLFRVNKQETVTSPVHVHDVAEALSRLVDAESMIGRTVSLPGPHRLTYADIMRIGEAAALRKLDGRNLPKPLLALASRFAQYATIVNPDWVARRYIDEKPVEAGTAGFADLNIEPESLEDLAVVYMRMYRPAHLYDRLITKGGHQLLKRQPYRRLNA